MDPTRPVCELLRSTRPCPLCLFRRHESLTSVVLACSGEPVRRGPGLGVGDAPVWCWVCQQTRILIRTQTLSFGRGRTDPTQRNLTPRTVSFGVSLLPCQVPTRDEPCPRGPARASVRVPAGLLRGVDLAGTAPLESETPKRTGAPVRVPCLGTPTGLGRDS